MLLPEPDQTILCRRDEIISALKRFVPAGSVIDDDTTMAAYDTDGLSAYRNQPLSLIHISEPRDREKSRMPSSA